MSIGKNISEIFRRRWNEIFIYDSINNRSYTYEEFFCLINQCSLQLQEYGLQKGDKIVLIMPNSVKLIALYFSCLIQNIIIISIDPKKGKKEIDEILSQINHKIIFSEQNLTNYKTTNFNLQNPNKKLDIENVTILLGLDYDSIFIITFTSGSTGTPKGVIHSFGDFFKSCIAFKKFFKFNSDNIFYHNLSMSYIGGILNLIILPFISESKIIVAERFDFTKIVNFWEIPKKFSANTFWFTPTIPALLLKLDRDCLGINYCKKNKIIGLVGMGSLDKTLKKNFEKKYDFPLYESYCLSETFFISSNYPENDKPECVGKLLPDVKILFSDEKEILIKSPGMFKNYLNVDTNQFFDEGYYLSGDLGEIDEQNFLKITGRKKDLIIKGGMNLSPKKIENFLLSADIFEEVVIIGIPDEIMGEKIVCFFVKRKKIYNIDLRKKLSRDLVNELGIDYRIDEFIELNHLPRNLNGKIDKQKLKIDFNTL